MTNASSSDADRCQFCAVNEGDACPFCRIIAGDEPAQWVEQWPEAVAFVPLTPCPPDPDAVHWLVVPRQHACDAADDATGAANAMWRAAQLVQERGVPACNIITSLGAAATQTVLHTHLHIVERRPGDNLHLPWPNHHDPAAPDWERRSLRR